MLVWQENTDDVPDKPIVPVRNGTRIVVLREPHTSFTGRSTNIRANQT